MLKWWKVKDYVDSLFEYCLVRENLEQIEKNLAFFYGMREMENKKKGKGVCGGCILMVFKRYKNISIFLNYFCL